MADAKITDPNTMRTIPVITKPDQIDKGAEKAVYDLLLGKKIDFNLGFHMVKCRGQKSLNEGMSIEHGLIEGEKFFTNESPWREEPNKTLFGIIELRKKLAKLQVRMIKDSIPSILKEITNKRNDASEEIEKLGSYTTTDLERRSCFAQALNIAINELKNVLDGKRKANDSDEMTLTAQQHVKYEKFRDIITQQKLANITKIDVGTKVIVTLADGNEQKGSVSYINKNAVSVVPTPLYAYGKAITVDINDIRSDADWIMELIRNHRNNDIQCFLNASLFNSIVSDMIAKNWIPHCFEILEDSKVIMLQIVKRTFSNSLPIRFPFLFAFLDDIFDTHLGLLYLEAKKEMTEFLEMEKVAYTQNHYLFEIISIERNKHLKYKILKMIEGVKNDNNQIMKIIETAFGANQRLSMEKHGALEMQIVLDAYGKVSAKRFMDNIPMIIQKMFRGIVPTIDKVLQRISDKELFSLMTEDESFVIKHNRATDILKKMDIAFAALKELQTGIVY